MRTWNRLAIPTISIPGAIDASVVMKTRRRLITVHAEWSVSRILTTTVTGGPLGNTEQSGSRTSRRAGLPIITAIGRGSIHGDGLGLTMRLGATRHFITAAG